MFILFCSRLNNFERNERKNLSDDSDKPFASSVEFDEQARNIVKTLLEKKVSSGLLIGLSGLVTACVHQISSKTIRKFCSIGRLEPDYELPNKNGGLEFYFEFETVQRFLRQVFKKPNDPKLFDENYICKVAKKKPSDFREL